MTPLGESDRFLCDFNDDILRVFDLELLRLDLEDDLLRDFVIELLLDLLLRDLERDLRERNTDLFLLDLDRDLLLRRDLDLDRLFNDLDLLLRDLETERRDLDLRDGEGDRDRDLEDITTMSLLLSPVLLLESTSVINFGSGGISECEKKGTKK